MIIIKKEQLEPINELIKTFSGTHKFCNNDLNKFILSLRKAVYPYEYMDKERFGKDLEKHHYQIKTFFAMICI